IDGFVGSDVMTPPPLMVQRYVLVFALAVAGLLRLIAPELTAVANACEGMMTLAVLDSPAMRPFTALITGVELIVPLSFSRPLIPICVNCPKPAGLLPM